MSSGSPRLPPIVNGFYALTDDLIVEPRRQGNNAAVRLRRSSLATPKVQAGPPMIPPTHSVAESKPQVDETKGTITQAFRMLSAVFIPGHCTDFYTEGAKLFTEEALPLFTDTTLYANHGDGFWSPPKVQNWLGKAINARISDRVALGVDADFVISLEQDRVLYQGAIARGLSFSPPAVDSASVTIWFTHRRSHPDLDDFEFYWKLGSVVDGQLVRFIVESIVRIPECSLVYAGADALARSFSLADSRPAWSGEAKPPVVAVPMNMPPPAAPVASLQLQAALPGAAAPPRQIAAAAGNPLAPRIAAMKTEDESSSNPRWHMLNLLYEVGELLALGPDLEAIASDELKPKITAALDALAELAPELLAGVRAAPAAAPADDASEEDAEKAADAAAVGDEDLTALAAALAVADRTEKGRLLQGRSFRAKRAPKIAQALSLFQYAQARFGDKKDAGQIALDIANLSVKAEQPKVPKQTEAQRREALMSLARQKGIPPVALLGSDKMSLSVLAALVNNHPGSQKTLPPGGSQFAPSSHPGGAAAASSAAAGQNPQKPEDITLSDSQRRQFRRLGITDEAKMRAAMFSMQHSNAQQLAAGLPAGAHTDDDDDGGDDDDDDGE